MTAMILGRGYVDAADDAPSLVARRILLLKGLLLWIVILPPLMRLLVALTVLRHTLRPRRNARTARTSLRWIRRRGGRALRRLSVGIVLLLRLRVRKPALLADPPCLCHSGVVQRRGVIGPTAAIVHSAVDVPQKRTVARKTACIDESGRATVFFRP